MATASYTVPGLGLSVPLGTVGKATAPVAVQSLGSSPCEIYRNYLARSTARIPAIEAALKARCDAATFGTRAGASPSFGGAPVASGGAEPAPTSEGPSPILLGAIALGVGLVGFVVWKKSKGKKR